jgi:hypothetical protein
LKIGYARPDYYFHFFKVKFKKNIRLSVPPDISTSEEEVEKNSK